MTQDILKEQKSNKNYSNLETLSDLVDGDNTSATLIKSGVLNRNSELYRSKCAKSCFFPFSIVSEDCRIELIATNSESIELWVAGLEFLAVNRKAIPKVIKWL